MKKTLHPTMSCCHLNLKKKIDSSHVTHYIQWQSGIHNSLDINLSSIVIILLLAKEV